MKNLEPDSKQVLSERTVLSLHVVVILLSCVVWLIRLDDKVLTQEKILNKTVKTAERNEKILYRVCEKLKIKCFGEE